MVFSFIKTARVKLTGRKVVQSGEEPKIYIFHLYIPTRIGWPKWKMVSNLLRIIYSSQSIPYENMTKTHNPLDII